MIGVMTTLAEFFSQQRIRPLAEDADNDADAATFHWLCVEDANPPRRTYFL